MCELLEEFETIDMDTELLLTLECGCEVIVRAGDIIDLDGCESSNEISDDDDIISLSSDTEDSGIESGESETESDTDSDCGKACNANVCFCGSV